MKGSCFCQKNYICIKDLDSCLNDVVIIDKFKDFYILYEKIKKYEKILFIDAEWKCAVFRENPIISIFQIALKNSVFSYIIDVKSISLENYQVNYYISDLFRDENIIKIGVAFLNNDMLHFRKYYDILNMLTCKKYKDILIDDSDMGTQEKGHKHKIVNINTYNDITPFYNNNMYNNKRNDNHILLKKKS